jgi:hypothetical protein
MLQQGVCSMNFDPQLASLLLTTGIGLTMVLAGLNKNALERRGRRRFCPACGRDLRACSCV